MTGNQLIDTFFGGLGAAMFLAAGIEVGMAFLMRAVRSGAGDTSD